MNQIKVDLSVPDLPTNRAYEDWSMQAPDPRLPPEKAGEASLPLLTVLVHLICRGNEDRFNVVDRALRMAFEAGHALGVASATPAATEPAMKAETLTALRKSIDRYQRYADGRGIGPAAPLSIVLGAVQCPLCAIHRDDECSGCPVYNATGRRACSGSPYPDASAALNQWRDAHLVSDDMAAQAAKWKFMAACQREADFLKGLLPPGE